MINRSRKEWMLAGLDIGGKHGLEIGPLCRPLITPDEGQIEYVDHLCTADLRIKYANDKNVAIDDIVPVSYVWGECSLTQLVAGKKFDYVVASHVIEHIPDIVSWIDDISNVLKPGGKLILAVPDMRYTFDCARQQSTFASIVTAFMEKRRHPSFAQVLDHTYESRLISPESQQQLWFGALDTKSLPRAHPDIIDACDEAFFREYFIKIMEGMYIDVHCHTFTPDSFLSIMHGLSCVGLLNFKIYSFAPTPKNNIEFYITLERLPDNLSKYDKLAAYQSSVESLDVAERSFEANVQLS